MNRERRRRFTPWKLPDAKKAWPITRLPLETLPPEL